MPTTTTAVNARDCVIYLDDASGTPQDISGSANKVQFDRKQELGEYGVFGDRALYRIAHRQDASFQISVIYTTSDGEGYALLNGWYHGVSGQDSAVPRTLRLIVPSDQPGSGSYQAEVLIANLAAPLDSALAGPILCSVELLPSGGIAYAPVES